MHLMISVLLYLIVFTPFARGQETFGQPDSKESVSKVSDSSEPPSKNTPLPSLKKKLSSLSPTLLAIIPEDQATDENKGNIQNPSAQEQRPRTKDLNLSLKSQQKKLPKDLKNFPLKITLPLYSGNSSNKSLSFQRFSPKDRNKAEKPTNLKTLLDAREKNLQELREKNKQDLPHDAQDLLKKIPYKYSFSPSSQKD